jgi:hypothetical protein
VGRTPPNVRSRAWAAAGADDHDMVVAVSGRRTPFPSRDPTLKVTGARSEGYGSLKFSLASLPGLIVTVRVTAGWDGFLKVNL